MPAYFVSDIHLRQGDEPKTKVLEDFLARLLRERACSHLFLVGDIFDLWIGSHAYFREKFSGVAEAVRALVASGVEVHYFEGNHDLHLHGFWERELGAHVHSGPAHFEIDGWKARVEHGDQMNPDDRGYLFLRWLLRTPPMRALALNLPARTVSAIGEWASHLSRSHPGVRPVEAIREMVRTHARKIHAREKFDFLIAGHVHVLEDSKLPEGGHVVNLGSWDDAPHVYRLDSRGGAFLSDVSKI